VQEHLVVCDCSTLAVRVADITSCCFAALSALTATYTQGQTITTTQTLTANHGGYLRIKVCPNSPGAATQACFDQNVLQGPTGSKYWLTSGTYMNSPPYTIAWTLPAGVSAELLSNHSVSFQHSFLTTASC
jgi:Lytic polysaccharide mono-oxygenase, cellulose-degrading